MYSNLGERHGPANGKRILLVEDQAIIAMGESMLLKREGYAIDTRKSGEEAVEYFEQGNLPNLVLMDIDLGPGMDGPEAARRILAGWDVPVVFLSSYASQDVVDRVKGIRRYGYVVKNGGEAILVSTIEMALELFDRDQTIRLQNSLLLRSEELARLGRWQVDPATERIYLSERARAILGMESEHVSFEAFDGLVAADDKRDRSRALEALIRFGVPYDVTYRAYNRREDRLVTVRSSGSKCGQSIAGVLQDLTDVERALFGLKETERRQAVTLRSIGDGVISTDRLGRVVELNRAAEELTGWDCGQAVGRPIEEVVSIVDSDTRAAVANPALAAMETGQVVGLANHTVLIAKDGRERHIADSGAPIIDDLGQVMGSVLIFRDVSERKRELDALRRNERAFKALFFESHTPTLLVDPESGAIREANNSAARLYGKTREDLCAMRVYDINAAAPATISGDMRKAIREPTEFRFTHRVAGGEFKNVRVISGPISVDDREYLLSIILDADGATSPRAARINPQI